MNIDFVEPRLPSRRMWVLGSLPMLLALSLWCVSIYWHARLAQQRDQRAAAELEMKAPPTVLAVRRAAPPYQAQALAAIQRANLPEADALAELEHVEVSGIQLRSIDVNTSQAIVVVELEAASERALGDYLDQLNAGDGAPRWHIQRLASLTSELRLSAGPTSSGFENSEGHSVFIARGL